MSKHAYVFPGQGAQFPGMAKELYEASHEVRVRFDQAADILGFDIGKVMFTGTDDELKQTRVTQPAIFLHSVAAYMQLENPKTDMTAGHSLGEFSALVAAKALHFEAALRLVSIRASAMQHACDSYPSTMAAVLALPDEKVEEICREVSEETNDVVVAANYNCPGQLVISGSIAAVEAACVKLKAAGAKRALVLPVGGAFHSPLMSPAREELAEAINAAVIETPICPIYQNVVAAPVTDVAAIRQNLVNQLTGPVKWTQTIQAMIADGASRFTECGPGKVLQGLVGKIDKSVATDGMG